MHGIWDNFFYFETSWARITVTVATLSCNYLIACGKYLLRYGKTCRNGEFDPWSDPTQWPTRRKKWCAT